MIPSKSTVWREGDKLLKKIGYPMFNPPERSEHALGEFVKLGYEKVV